MINPSFSGRRSSTQCPRSRFVLAPFFVSILLLASAPFLLTNGISSAQAQVDDGNDNDTENENLPYLIVMPNDTVLNVAEQNSIVDAFGRNFCPL